MVYCTDRSTGLLAIIAIHSTALGPALGGTRFHPYASEDEALADVLRLSKAMSYKNALAGLDHDGGKAVIVGDPKRDKSPDLLRAYGRFVDSLGGRYVTAADVGTYVEDLDVVGEVTAYATGRSPAKGGAGDSSVLTALGVYGGMRACAEAVWGKPTLAGRRVGVAGVGKVGSHLVRHLLEDGADVLVTDVDQSAVDRVRADHPEVTAVRSTDELVEMPLDVYSPNALGGALDDATVQRLTAVIVCGGANNQLARPGVEDELHRRGVLYAPDFLVNAGGVIQVADELLGFDMDRARGRAEAIGTTTREVLKLAETEAITPTAAAERLAEARIAAGQWRDRLFPGLRGPSAEPSTTA